MTIASRPDTVQAIAIAESNQLERVTDDKLQFPGMVNPVPGWIQGHSPLSQQRFDAVFQDQHLRTYGHLIREMTLAMMNDWPLGTVQSVHLKTSMLSRQLILRVVFGIEDEQRFQRLAPDITLLLQRFDSLRRARGLLSPLCRYPLCGWHLLDWTPWKRFLRLRQRLDPLLEAEIQNCGQPSIESRNDLLQFFLAAEYQAREAISDPESDTELRNSVLGFLFMCHETIASALVWALYWIDSSPGVCDRMVQEIDALGPEPDAIAVSQLPYLTAVCLETLRLRPIFPFRLACKVKQAFKLMDASLEQGTILMPCGYLVHRCPEVYPEPGRFEPERFLGKQFSDNEYFPFGEWSNTCPGAFFAQFELKLALATLLSHFQLTIDERHAAGLVRRNLVTTNAQGLKMTIRRRLGQAWKRQHLPEQYSGMRI